MNNPTLLRTVALVLAELGVPEDCDDWQIVKTFLGADYVHALNVPLIYMPGETAVGEWYGERLHQRDRWVTLHGLPVYAYEIKPEADIDPAELPKPEEPEADGDTHEGIGISDLSVTDARPFPYDGPRRKPVEEYGADEHQEWLRTHGDTEAFGGSDYEGPF